MSDFDWLERDSEEWRLRRKLARSKKRVTPTVDQVLTDEDALRSLGISPPVARPLAPRTPLHAPADDSPRGLANLQEIMRAWRPKSEITRSEGWWQIGLRSSILKDEVDLMFAVRIDVDRTPRKGDVILTSGEGRDYGREYDFALVTRVVSTGGLQVRKCRWNRRIGHFSYAFSFSRQWLAWGFVNVEGVITTPERLQVPARRLKNGRWSGYGEQQCRICGKGPDDPIHKGQHGGAE